MVTENDNGLLPDPSNCQKRKKSLIIPAGFRLDPEIQCKESPPRQKGQEKAGVTKNEMDSFAKSKKSLPGESLSNLEPAQKPQCTSIHFVNTEATEQGPSNHENTSKPCTNSGYVDIQRHVESLREVDVKQVDYSRVKEVNANNTIILETENLPLNSSGYMDVQRREEGVSEDYSRVKEVDCMIFLQKQNASVDASCREKGNQYTDCALQKPRNPRVTGVCKVGVCTELIDSGYVDTIPASPLM